MWAVGRLVAALGTAVTAVVVTLAVGGATAGATSCAPPTDGSARSIVAGTEVLWGDHAFFELYDYAVTGTVVDVVTDETQGSATYGATEVHVEVINGFGVDQIGERVVVHQSDPGWMSGFAFERGSTYFIPLVHVGPNGEPDYSFLCDPISRISPDGARQLTDLAADSIAVADPSPSAVVEPVAAPPTSRPDVAELAAGPRPPSLLPPLLGESATDDGAAPILTFVGLAVALAAGTVAFDVYRRRTSSRRPPTSEPS